MAVVVPSIRGGQVEKFAPGDRITMTVAAGQTVRGGRLVEFTANRTVQEAGAGSVKCAGVALYDGAAAAKVTIGTEGVWILLAAGAIAAGDSLICGAAGTVVAAGATPDARTLVAKAYEAIADTAVGPCKLNGTI